MMKLIVNVGIKRYFETFLVSLLVYIVLVRLLIRFLTISMVLVVFVLKPSRKATSQKLR